MAKQAMIGLGLDENVSQGLNDIKESIKDVGGTSKELDKIAQQFAKIESKALPAKRELKELKGIMTTMNLKGLTNTDVFTEIAARAGEIKDAMGDAAQAVSLYSNDVQNMAAVGDVFTGIASAGSIATGIMGAFGVESDKVAKILLKVQSAQAILNGVTQLANVLNKDSAIMLKLKQIRQIASTAATTADTVATGVNTAANVVNNGSIQKGTAAQTAWNVAKAIAKALIGDFTGLLLVGAGALATYAIATSDSTDELEKNTDAANDNKDATEALSDSLNNNIAKNVVSLVGKYRQLQQQWEACSSAHEKNQFIKDNATEFQNLGLAIDNVTDAENVFVNNSDKFVQALMQRAQAAAYATVAQEEYEKAIRAQIQLDKLNAKVTEVNRTQNTLRARGAGRSNYVDRNNYVSTGPYAKQLQATIKESTQNFEKLNDASINLNKSANTVLTNTKGGGNKSTTTTSTTPHKSTSSTNTGPKYAAGSLTDLETQLSSLKKDYKDGLLNISAETYTKTVKRIEDQIKKKKVELGLEIDTTPVAGSITDMEDKLSKLKKNLQDGLVPQDKIEETKAQIKKLEKDIENDKIKLGLEVDPKIAKIDELKKEFDKIEFTPKISSFDQATGAGSDNKSLDSIRNQMDFNDNLLEQLEELKKQYEELGETGSNAYNEVEKKIADTKEAQEELNDEASKRSKAQKNAEKQADAFGSLGDMLGSVQQAFSALGDSEGAEVAQFAVGTAATLANAASTIAAMNAEALAKGASSAFALPFPANLAAWATILSTITSIFASLPKFADGGVFTGGSKIGDMNLARVNSGEMILNGKQQANLFRALDEGVAAIHTQNISISGRVKGKDLALVLSNYNGVKKLTGNGLSF